MCTERGEAGRSSSWSEMDGQPRKEKKQLTESHADTPTHTLGTLDLDAPTPNSDSECSPRRPGGTLADRQAGRRVFCRRRHAVYLAAHRVVARPTSKKKIQSASPHARQRLLLPSAIGRCLPPASCVQQRGLCCRRSSAPAALLLASPPWSCTPSKVDLKAHCRVIKVKRA